MAAAKEIHYFSRYFERGETWYKSHFVGSDHMPIVGEFSTSYMLDPAVPQRMASLIPEAKLLFILRNPIERAYSNYWFSLSIGTQDASESFSEVIRTPKGFENYIASGCYYRHLERFLAYFRPEQIYVMITEEFKREPLKQMALCYQYLGVNAVFQPDVNKTYNVTLTTTNKWLATAFRSWVTAKKQVKPFVKRFPMSWRRNLAQFEKQTVQQVLSTQRPEMPAEDRTFLADIYAEPNSRLASFIGKDLDDWR